MVESINDPYTVFFPPAEATSFESEIEGNFEGVGMEMGIKSGVLTVITPLKNSPAEKAGIRPGDKVIQIEGKITTDYSIDQAVKLIRGKKGTTVTLLVVREGVEKPIEVKIVRDVINLPTIDTKLDPKTNIFTIKLYTFSAQSASLFRNALREFVESKSNKLILDLRGNPGGFLDAAVDMASWFLPPGKTVVMEDYGNGKTQVVERSRGYNIFNENLRMVILIDGGSASASEILAGALSEYGKAKLVGTKSFGKGSVQEYIKLNSETALKVTVARWLTPNGKSISEGGLTPDVEVKVTPEDITAGRDPQMDKAIELLK
jgi:carboxyl-terminal processing protease